MPDDRFTTSGKKWKVYAYRTQSPHPLRRLVGNGGLPSAAFLRVHFVKSAWRR